MVEKFKFSITITNGSEDLLTKIVSSLVCAMTYMILTRNMPKRGLRLRQLESSNLAVKLNIDKDNK